MNRDLKCQLVLVLMAPAMAACKAGSDAPVPSGTAGLPPEFELAIRAGGYALGGPGIVPLGKFNITLVSDLPQASETDNPLLAPDEGNGLRDLQAGCSISPDPTRSHSSSGIPGGKDDRT